MGFSGAWRTGSYTRPPLQGTVPDHSHREPSQHDTGRNWQRAPRGPVLMPTDQVDHDSYTLDSAGGGLPWNPPGPHEGVGFGAGLSFAASSAQNDAAHLTDDGSYIPRAWQPAVERDGTYHVDRTQLQVDPAGIGSPGWIELQRGLNPAAYPNRRTGHRIARWRDREYLRRTWDVEFRPIVTPNAYTAPALGAVSERNQYVSPFPDSVAAPVRVVNTTAPQMRRTPAPWDESITQDGASSGAPYSDPSFHSWGL